MVRLLAALPQIIMKICSHEITHWATTIIQEDSVLPLELRKLPIPTIPRSMDSSRSAADASARPKRARKLELSISQAYAVWVQVQQCRRRNCCPRNPHISRLRFKVHLLWFFLTLVLLSVRFHTLFFYQIWARVMQHFVFSDCTKYAFNIEIKIWKCAKPPRLVNYPTTVPFFKWLPFAILFHCFISKHRPPSSPKSQKIHGILPL